MGRRVVARATWGLMTLAVTVVACGPPEKEPAKVADGIYAEKMGEIMKAATEEEREVFERGEAVALHRFTPEEGLGPDFNVAFCASCHEQPTAGGSSPRYRNFHLIAQKLPDGTLNMLGKDGVHTQFDTMGPLHRNPTPEDADLLATRNAIPFFGVGALAEVPEESILKHADPEDKNGDGISGRPNYDRGFVGRFGRKAQTVSLEGFVRGPIFNHLGITSNPLPNERKAELPVPSDLSDEEMRRVGGALGLEGFCPTCQAAAPEEPLMDGDDAADPEMGQDQLFDIVSWVMLMGAPKPDPPTRESVRGEVLFQKVGCAKCHVPGLEGPRGRVMAYTDLLLHDMGPELADGLSQGEATGSEFRTQPLWGVAATEPYLHDGRADTLDEAIRLHGGEAKGVRDAYMELEEQDREDIIAFLRSLGGADQDSEGLIPPEQEPPAAGQYGGPVQELSDEERARFERGRRLFDRDFTPKEGLGETFNGDSCRGCHFDPAVGGSGPAGLAVTREGHVDPMSGEFTPPPGGTLLRRFSVHVDERPGAHPDSNVFELRQPPPIFGLGQIDAIPESELAAHADPMDMDGDGISGRIARPGDGRPGKFGWKGAFPTLEDFVRDALSNEMGLTLAPKDGLVAGRTSDEDGVEDPEFSGRAYEDLVFFNAMLAPPPRTNVDAPAVQQGETVFEDVGCADCHVPTMKTDAGEEVHLYSDLLLHETTPADYMGVAEADATMREFRTPPLWGISRTAPYMHDGLAGTLDEAIRRHSGEAEAVTERYRKLSKDEREALLDFLHSL